MTMRSRSTVLAFCLRGCVCAGAAWMLMVGPNVAWAQQLVRLNSGEGASILPSGRSYRLGERLPSPAPAEVSLEASRGTIRSICCPGPNSQTQPSCVTERQIRANATRADVVGRYGPPQSGSDSQLRYSGISFALEQGRVKRICVVPRSGG